MYKPSEEKKQLLPEDIIENQKQNLQQLAAQNLDQEKEIKKLKAELDYLRSDRETLKNTIVQMVVSKYGY